MKRWLTCAFAALLGTLAYIVPGSPAQAVAGGPVVLTGIDAEDCGPGGHGPIANYVSLVNSILANANNGGDGILVIGANGGGPTAFWNAIGSGTGEAITFGADTAAFTGFQMLAIVGSSPQTCDGLSAAQNATLGSRQLDVANFVNAGGGLLGNTQSDFAPASQYGYVGGLGQFASASRDYSDIDPTADGLAVGITNALDVCCWHNVFTTFPSFLTALAFEGGTQNAAAIGGSNVVLPSQIMLSPATATNPVGTTHTVTATVRDGQGVIQPGVLVSFSVAGANAGATGTCNPPSCTTDAVGNVTFTYTGAAAGDDVITACFTPPSGTPSCTTATKSWIGVQISISDVSVTEGDSGTTPAVFTVSLSAPTSSAVTVDYATALVPGGASATDFVATSGTLQLPANTASVPLAVLVNGDVVDEPNETFVVNLSNPTGGVILDGQGVGTIIDDDRNGKFSCRASSLRLGTTEPLVANAPNSPCVDATRSLASASIPSGLIRVGASVLSASTDQTPDNLESTAPAAGDNGKAVANVAVASVSLPGLTIATRDVHAEAKVECVAGPAGLQPALTGSSTIGTLTINGVAVSVSGSRTITLPLGLGSVDINRTVSTSTSLTRQAIRIRLGQTEIVISEAKANFSGNPCAQ